MSACLERLPHYDAWRTREPREPKAIATCPTCGEDIFPGDNVFEFDGRLHCCQECANDAAEITAKVAGE